MESRGLSSPLVLRSAEPFRTRGSFGDGYELEHVIACGAWAQVRQCTDRKTGRRWAVKVILVGDEPASEYGFPVSSTHGVYNELEMMASFQGLHFLHLREFFVERIPGTTAGVVYAVMELADGGDLHTLVARHGPLTENEARHVLRTVFGSLKEMHRHGVVHRDIKLENLLVTTDSSSRCGSIKVADLGLATMLDRGTCDGFAGTLKYMAPEVLAKSHRLNLSKPTTPYDEKCDIWSCGVVLYAILSGCAPFEGDDAVKVYDGVRKGIVDFSNSVWDKVSCSAKDLIRGCLELNPHGRLTAEEALQHPWLSSNRMPTCCLQ